MSLVELYQTELEKNSFEADRLQAAAVEKLNNIEIKLTQRLNTGWHKKILRPDEVKGLYMYGGVGRGKTFLLDLFYKSLKTAKKQRLHYHALMQQIHSELGRLHGVKNPVSKIVKGLKTKTEILCLDELFVHDIGDAMLMAELMQEIKKQKIILVITSNTAPDDLYKYGLQRSRFLPAIEHIKNMTECFNFSGSVDYRLEKIIKNFVFFKHDAKTRNILNEAFKAFSKNLAITDKPFTVGGRQIICKKRSPSSMWILFDELCNRPHGQKDYLELARNMEYLIIENIPNLTDEETDQAARFINLIDVCYDAKVKLVASIQGEVDDIYCGRSLNFDFKRTKSRLNEMKSEEYWLKK